MKVALLMDPIEGINIEKDTTFVIGLEAQARGHELYYFTPHTLCFDESCVVADVAPLTLRREKGNHFDLAPFETTDLNTFDVIWMRQDPPFDMAYITATYLLERLDKAWVINPPQAVRTFSEKLSATLFPKWTPPTLIAREEHQIRAFQEKHGDIVIKPLYSCGGEGVFRFPKGAPNLRVVIELYQEKYREPFVIQKYLPAAAEGDKRIIMCDGEPIGAVLRVPNGDHRANFHAGGQAAKTALSDREQEICADVGAHLKQHGLFFVGLDLIGGYLTEINVTSPTCVQEINALENTCLEQTVWDRIEAKRLRK